MECKECTEVLLAYYDGEIDGSVRSQVHEHLEKCFSCQNELDDLSADMNFFKVNMLVLKVDSRFAEKVMHKINAQ